MERKHTNGRPGLLDLAGFAARNANLFKALRRRDAAKATLCLANLELGKLDPAGAVRAQRTQELNRALIELYRGRWYATAASRAPSPETWRRAFAGFRNAKRLGRAVLRRLKERSAEPVKYAPVALERRGTELDFADEVPLVPEITPLVFLQGSDHDMGRQYAHQLVDIFGRWILARHAGARLSEQDRAELGRWEAQHRQHTPWLLAFCRGWADEAAALGLPMSYEDVLDLWVGHAPPATDYLGSGGLPDVPPLACSAVAAWGRATADGHLVTGSTGDHDLSYQLTIVAFPSEGHAFIYSPFGATGEIAGAGAVYFFGHPGINDQGLAYVHHGGGPKFLEPKRHWGYGLRRAAAVIHALRFCDTARQARALEESWPIGDVGRGDQATVGGFWADDEYGCVVEGRKEPVAIREAGLLGERDFLYANNSVAHPRAAEAEWLARDRAEWTWDEHGGWRPKAPTGMTRSLALMFAWASGRLSTGDVLRRGMRYAYTNSCARNRFLFDAVEAQLGQVDVESMKQLYRTGGTLPEGPWRAVTREYARSGAWGQVSAAHPSNAMTVVTKPREGLYWLCTGPARRGLAPMMPGSTGAIYGETNAFWEVRLARSPEEAVEHARARAMEHLAQAQQALAQRPVHLSLQQLVERAAAEFTAGEELGRGASLYELSKALRAYTRAQVRALQVSQALAPPPARFELVPPADGEESEAAAAHA